MTQSSAPTTANNHLFVTVNLDSPTQKRAVSYANTIHMLFSKVMSDKMPADRILAEYFREHKKHGSKDRKVIRETLFSVFRWWGWLQHIATQQTDAEQQDKYDQYQWLAILSFASAFESHKWQDIAQTWAVLSQQDIDLSDFYTRDNNDIGELARLFNQTSDLQVALTQLVPTWFWDVCQVTDKAEQQALLQALSTRPPIWARVQNTTTGKVIKQLADEGVDASQSEYFSGSLNLGVKSINLPGLKSYQQGLFEIQDLGSQVIGQICQPKHNEHWWDACSGAGGKTLQLRALMLQQDANSNGTITASDIRRKPLEELLKRAKRAGFNHISTKAWKSDALPVEANTFDGVLVDAPCSCLGTWRRNPDMRWLDDRSCVDDKTQLQLDILTRSAKAVKNGGKLVYATCSLSALENEHVVTAFLSQHTDFSLVPQTHPFTQAQLDMLTVWPQQANSDGMFVAVMLKN